MALFFKQPKSNPEINKKLEEQEALIDKLKKQLEAKKVVKASVECDCRDKLQDLVKNEAALRKEISDLEKQERKARADLEKTKLDHKITIEDIKHMQKMLDEKNGLELEKKSFEAEKNANKEIEKIRVEYAKKLENELMVERKKMQEFMERVMDALPNVNVKLKG